MATGIDRSIDRNPPFTILELIALAKFKTPRLEIFTGGGYKSGMSTDK